MKSRQLLSRREFLRTSTVVAGAGLLASGSGLAASGGDRKRPNILWITCEDTGPELGCYGDEYAVTPNLDAFAAKAMRYRVAWSTAPVCAPARTTIITGVYPPSTGSEHMRSEVKMPGFMRMYPQILREAGYYCTNNSKEDYNLTKPGKVWDESSRKGHWKNRAEGQPFFSIFNITVSHESQLRKRPHTLKHDMAKAPIPAYHPDTPEVRHDWAQYYDKVTEMDALAGQRLRELEEAGLMDDTIVFFYGDHGSGMPRSKRWPYNSGLHVAMIVYVPEKFKHLAPKEYETGGESDRLVGFVDLAPTLLSIVGIKPPDWMQGHAFLGEHETPPQPYIFGFRGRMDERYDMVRSIRNQRYIYIRQYMPHLIYGQYIAYMFQTPTTQVWKELYDEGKLNDAQRRFWERKAPEELYDLENDPSEVVNLVDSPAHQEVLEELRQALREHTLRIRDVGFLSEAEMHSRAVGTTIYEMGHDPSKYPLEHILAMADVASLMKPRTLAKLRDGLADDDSAVRYWAAMGLLMRGRRAARRARQDLRTALQDESPTVRIIAARALGEYGNDADLKLALPVLEELAPPDKNGAYVSILDLNAIAALGEKATPLMETIKAMPTKDPAAVGRANSYVGRLVQSLVGPNTGR
jgi:uncharacterized sulfatase